MSIARTLVWKEVNEQKWRVLSFCAMILSLQAYAMVRDEELVVAISWGVLWIYALFGPVFLAMGAVAGERARGTFDLVCALPVRPSRVMLAKLLVGAVSCAIPVAAAILLLAVWTATRGASIVQPMRELSEFFGLAPIHTVLLVGLMIAGSSIAVFVWAAAAGVRQPTELRAGLAAVIVIAAWIFVLVGGLIHMDGPHGRWFGSAYSILLLFSPGGLMSLTAGQQPPWPLLAAAQVLALLVLGAWTLRRYGTVTGAENPSRTPAPAQAAKAPPSLGPPRRSAVTAIAWKQGRETLPVVVAGLVLVVGLTAANLVGEQSAPLSDAWTRRAATNISTGSLVLGFLVALIVGVGTFAPEMQTRLLAFWRSRPIGVGRWFWTKYLTGAVTILIVLHGPVVLARWLEGGASSIPGDAYLGCVPLAHLAVYTIAVWLACALRQAVYAGVLGFGLALALVLGPGMEPALERFALMHVLDEVSRQANRGIGAWLSSAYLPFLIVMSSVVAVALALAWTSVRSDAVLEGAR